MLTREDLAREAAAAGFRVEPLEKAIRLLELLETMRSHPFLKDRIALKGGTALNLFVFDVPRLSVDIDLNYIGAVDRETMLEERPKIEQAVQAVCGRLGIQTRRIPSEHAGGKWRLSYEGASGHTGTLELDMSFILRTPLWPPVLKDSRPIGSFSATQIPLLDLHELAAGKLSALFSRIASRDLFDTHNLLKQTDLDRTRLRLAFVVYGGASRRDWRTIGVEDIQADPKDIESRLLPVLRADLTPARSKIPSWSKKLVKECRELLSWLFPLNDNEIEFLDYLNAQGEIRPALIALDNKMQAIIGSHPGLLWKALNVRERKGRK